MSYFVVVPGALVPTPIASPLLARAKVPRLMRFLQHAKAEPLQFYTGDGAAHLDWLWTKFGGDDNSPVTAPYAWRVLDRSPGAETMAATSELPIWHADPVHFAFARDHMLVVALDAEAAVSVDESRELSASAAAVAEEFGATLRALDPRHWFISFDPAWRLKTIAYDAALGRSAQHVLPEGEAAARWRKLLNEIQMRWHQHPINEQRDAQGVRTINGLWLHGGGLWRALPKRPFDAVATNNATVRGWALASGLAPTALLASDVKPASAGSALVYYEGLLNAARLEDWDGWLEAIAGFDNAVDEHVTHALAQGSAAVTLVLAGRAHVRSIVLRRSDRLRLWRTNTLVDLLCEPERT